MKKRRREPLDVAARPEHSECSVRRERRRIATWILLVLSPLAASHAITPGAALAHLVDLNVILFRPSAACQMALPCLRLHPRRQVRLATARSQVGCGYSLPVTNRSSHNETSATANARETSADRYAESPVFLFTVSLSGLVSELKP